MTPRELQTASIRPMAQRATTQAVVLPTSQVSQDLSRHDDIFTFCLQVSSAGLTGEVATATVQPTVSGAGSVSAAQQPSTSQPQVRVALKNL